MVVDSAGLGRRQCIGITALRYTRGNGLSVELAVAIYEKKFLETNKPK